MNTTEKELKKQLYAVKLRSAELEVERLRMLAEIHDDKVESDNSDDEDEGVSMLDFFAYVETIGDDPHNRELVLADMVDAREKMVIAEDKYLEAWRVDEIMRVRGNALNMLTVRPEEKPVLLAIKSVSPIDHLEPGCPEDEGLAFAIKSCRAALATAAAELFIAEAGYLATLNKHREFFEEHNLNPLMDGRVVPAGA